MANFLYNFLLLVSFFFLFHLPLFLPCSCSVSFKIPSFKLDEPRILYHGDASPSDGTIEFNKPNFLCRVGWATYAQSVQIWDSHTGKLTDFATNFSFTIDIGGHVDHGNGFAFFLAPVGFEIPPNSGGGYLGLFNTTTSHSARNRIVTVEFDSYPNEEWEPKFEHVGINNNSITSSVLTGWNVSRHSGDTADVQIAYNGTSNNLTVSWKFRTSSVPGDNSSLFFNLDLRKALPEWVTVGFSAATGKNVERHILKSWEFSSSLDENGKSSFIKKPRSIVSVTVSGCGFLAAVVIAVVVYLKRKQKLLLKKKQKQWETAAEKTNLTSMNTDLDEIRARPKVFSYEDLVLATNNFSSDRKLGEGGFGVVYRGYSTDLFMAVAVKKFSQGSKQGRKEYKTEVKIISRLRHRNLVQLIGWCHDKGEFLLVYEFVPNGSLDAHLFGKRSPPSWVCRYC